MAPKEVDKKKEESDAPANRSQSGSTSGAKRSAEEEKAGENPMKRKRAAEKAKGESETELAESPQESMTSFMDMPDDCIIPIVKFLDLPSRLNLRVNKRLDGIHFAVKNNVETLTINVNGRSSCQVSIDDHDSLQTRNLTQLEQGFRRFAVNTSVDWVWIWMDIVPKERHCRIIDAIFQFKARSLYIHEMKYNRILSLPLSSFLTLVQNVRIVEIMSRTSLTAQDLCVIRKTMLEGGCMMQSFVVSNNGMTEPFLKECFGVSIEDVTHPINGKMYSCADDSLEMYKSRYSIFHCEGDLETVVRTVPGQFIAFKKLQVVNKPDDNSKLKLNHFYAD